MTRNTGIHIFHIIGICPWTYMPAILYLYVPLYWYHILYRPHITSHISKIKPQLVFTMLLLYMCHQEIWPYMSHMPITLCAHMKQLCQCICLIWSHWKQCHHNALVCIYFTLLLMPQTIMPATLHMHVPVHYYCGLKYRPHTTCTYK